MRRLSSIARTVGLNIVNYNEVLIDRLRLLATIGRFMGLDIYIEARKGASSLTGAFGADRAAPLAIAG
jgi:hypothetical protein